MNFLERQFWKLAKYILRKGYGYCTDRDGKPFLHKERCGACNASDVQDWIDTHIELIK